MLFLAYRDDDDDDDVGLQVLACRVDILGTNCNQLTNFSYALYLLHTGLVPPLFCGQFHNARVLHAYRKS